MDNELLQHYKLTQRWGAAIFPVVRTSNDLSDCSVCMEREMIKSMGLLRDLEKETADW